MKLLGDLNIDIIKFKNTRKTNTGSRIIDVDCDELFQTPWLKIVYDVDYTICVNAEKIKDTLKSIDEKIIKFSSTALNFSEEEIKEMYRPLLKNENFSISILSTTILFDRYRNFYDKSEIKNILKVGHYVRFIIKFKKIYFKDHIVTFPLELVQIEVA